MWRLQKSTIQSRWFPALDANELSRDGGMKGYIVAWWFFEQCVAEVRASRTRVN
ncbi:MAG: hypothetical protein K2X93_19250 [Candidatus Obscuribacterales bacterium]|nr:hypothetical protein [Candidatus Obscuribacterales bacterium]